MPITELLPLLAASQDGPILRTLAVGFADAAGAQALARQLGGEWWAVVPAAAVAAYAAVWAPGMAVAGDATGLPFEDRQFEQVVLDGAAVSAESVREAHRVLVDGGRLAFVLGEADRRRLGAEDGKALYRQVLRSGFDLISAERPAWWQFRRDRSLLSVLARTKSWRERRHLGSSAIVGFQLGS